MNFALKKFVRKKVIRNKLKIIIIGPAAPLRGGISSFNMRLAEEFQKFGHDVSIYSYYVQYPSFLFPGKTQFMDTPPPENLKIISSISSINPISWIKTARAINLENPDIILARFWIPFLAPTIGSILRLIKNKAKLTKIGLVDNIVPHEKRFGDRFLAKYYTANCDAFLVMSATVETELKSFTKKPIVNTPHPLYDNYGEKVSRETATTFLNLDTNFNYILFFGFIRKYKGLDILLEALTDERIRKLNLKLIVAGEFYEDEKPYTDFIEQKNLTQTVILHNKYISDEDVKYYFSAAQCVVQPYRNATQSGITQMAYHFGVPMIVTNVGGLAEIVPDGKTGFVTRANAVEIADAIIKINTPHSLPDFETALEIQREKFSWKKIVQTIIKLKKNTTS